MFDPFFPATDPTELGLSDLSKASLRPVWTNVPSRLVKTSTFMSGSPGWKPLHLRDLQTGHPLKGQEGG